MIDVPAVALAVVAPVLLVRLELNATWLVLGGAVCGWALHAAGLVG